MAYQLRDIALDSNGDLQADATGDLKISTPQESIEQMLEFRLRTNALEFIPAPYLGANLDRHVGKPNTRNTGREMTEDIVRCLTFDNLFKPTEVAVEVVPISYDRVMAVIFIKKHVVDASSDSLSRTPPLTYSFVIGLQDYTIQRVTGTTE